MESKIIQNSLGKLELSNCFLSWSDLKKNISDKKMEMFTEKNIVLLIEKRPLYFNMYYFIKKDAVIEDRVWTSLREDISKYNDLTTNILLKGNNRLSEDIIKHLNFSLYKTYIRKSFVNSVKQPYRELMNVEFARSKDAKEIYCLLYGSFDAKVSYLPSKEELMELIDKKWTLKICINNEIAGVLLFEDVGKKSYARVLCVKEEYRNNVIGYSLFAKYINMHMNNIHLFYLWVDRDNREVLSLHDKFGYREDGLIDNIYIRKDE